MDAAFKAIADYGITIVAIVAVSLLAFWLIRKLLEAKDAQIADSQKQRDVAQAGWQGATAAVEKLTEALRERTDLMERLASR